MIVWMVVAFLLWVALAGGVWAVLTAHGEREQRALDETTTSELGRQ